MHDREIIELVDKMIKMTRPSIFHRVFYSIILGVLAICCIISEEILFELKLVCFLVCLAVLVFIWISYSITRKRYDQYYSEQISLFKKLLNDEID